MVYGKRIFGISKDPNINLKNKFNMDVNEILSLRFLSCCITLNFLSKEPMYFTWNGLSIKSVVRHSYEL